MYGEAKFDSNYRRVTQISSFENSKWRTISDLEIFHVATLPQTSDQASNFFICVTDSGHDSAPYNRVEMTSDSHIATFSLKYNAILMTFLDSSRLKLNEINSVNPKIIKSAMADGRHTGRITF